ncbi:M61 family metallopeptidase [Lacihabitans soyangensis]|uniref:M61 family peptidase n=1 Tax=Lacihabitans soyangensis TaxID=869394 RepID=A0AAE3KTQ2_9BACT|nr:M61 family peptidase [Lacihabitans soyangensis]MCP9764707.1 M61 family peptidase [Lacihabitans soyangensis]
MIQYFFSFLPENNLVDIRILIPKVQEKSLELHLPMWRPGRYQLQNFVKNVLNFSARVQNGEKLEWRKSQKNIWQVADTQDKNVEIRYQYFAKELNAGSSFVNKHFLYVNPVNLCLYLPKLINETFEVNIYRESTESEYSGGLGVVSYGNTLKLQPKDFHHFFDSPFIISKGILHERFSVGEVWFHVWIEGVFQIDKQRLIRDLSKIAETQIRIFGEFPEQDYHFMLIVPENTFYHGVEHRNSTVMVLGENGVLPETYYNDLLGLASHELFHAWNIAKIRPKELLPYDYGKENYFETCFVAEGFTTYYGDKILLESGVIGYEEYLHELETTFRRHFEESDNASQSLLESSFDLWVDGYEKGTPNKKVSVYSKGAIVALILDLKIRAKFKEKKSLDHVMKVLWKRYGDMKRGYTYLDIQKIAERVYGENLREYFEIAIEGNGSIFDYTSSHLVYLGLQLEWIEDKCRLKVL